MAAVVPNPTEWHKRRIEALSAANKVLREHLEEAKAAARRHVASVEAGRPGTAPDDSSSPPTE